MVDRTKNRSDKYQHVLVESPYAPDVLTKYADAEAMYTKREPELKEELLDLQDQLKKEYWRLVDTKLTERQSQVLHLYAENKTQIEIAKILNVNQSSITKSMNGNCDYRNGKKIYGGANKKLKRLASKDPKICAILKRIAEIQSELSE